MARRISGAICNRLIVIWRSGKFERTIWTHVMSLAERILEQPMELIDGVEETLAELGVAARSDAVHQGASGGAEAEGRPLRPGRAISRTRRS